MNEFYVYLYRRNDTNDVFYIGKGKGYRAEMINGHNDHCVKIAKKYGFYIEYYAVNLPETRAFQLESDSIHRFVEDHGYSIEIEGYRDRNNPHVLCNHSFGGEGECGKAWDDEHKEFFRKLAIKNNAVQRLQTSAARDKARKTRAEQAKRGELYIQSKEFREFQRKRMVGNGNISKRLDVRAKISGKNAHQAIAIICIDNNMTFDTQSQLAKYAGVTKGAITNAFRRSQDGVIKLNINNTCLRFMRKPKISLVE